MGIVCGHLRSTALSIMSRKNENRRRNENSEGKPGKLAVRWEAIPRQVWHTWWGCLFVSVRRVTKQTRQNQPQTETFGPAIVAD